MKWQDERYIRVYTRDTPGWVAQRWEARAVLPLIERKLDRVGAIDLGEDGIDGLAILIGMPVTIVRDGVTELLKRGKLVQTGTVLLEPDFIEAQEVPKADRDRAREYRARKRQELLSNHEDGEPEHDSGSVTNVTNVRDASQNVTPCLTVPSLTEPSQTNSSATPHPADAGDSPDVGQNDPKPDKYAEAIREIHAHWVHERQLSIPGSKAPKLDRGRAAKVRARLREGRTVDELKRAVTGCLRTEFNVKGGYTDLTLICRDDTHVERYLGQCAKAEVLDREAENDRGKREESGARFDWMAAVGD